MYKISSKLKYRVTVTSWSASWPINSIGASEHFKYLNAPNWFKIIKWIVLNIILFFFVLKIKNVFIIKRLEKRLRKRAHQVTFFFIFSNFQTRISCTYRSNWPMIWVSLESPWPKLVEKRVKSFKSWLLKKNFFWLSKALIIEIKVLEDVFNEDSFDFLFEF